LGVFGVLGVFGGGLPANTLSRFIRTNEGKFSRC